ncbi:putative ferric-chelate reductase 1 isoform X3 [Mercenaria mercenaria]|uniref:putative ferric-chelate reductase 1 isoform X3 n=1 Tax=Mercenaria mercenaria TaxID=6596 RepID=UPI00234F334F|nr:putative ferric-chelate reductase 1 isoform X3 [Mercenaria mercenaria]
MESIRMLEAVFIMILVPGVISYGIGPPSSVCGNMMPGHGKVAQSSKPPYIIKFQPDKTTYSDSEEIQVTLEGKDNTKFRGFMIQARPDANTYTTYGSMSKTPDNTKNECISEGAGKNVAITHSDGSDKTSITFTWRAPATDVGNITFVYTVVQVKATFWVKAESSMLTYKPGAGTEASTAPSQTTKTQTDSQTDVPTTPQPNQIIKKDSRCGKSVGCYHDCDSSDSCGFLLTWMQNGDDIDFTLTCKQGSNSVYCAIGLSKDNKMGDDSVFECVSSDGTVSVFVSYNDGRNNYRLKMEKFGVSKITAVHQDGILKCTFSRKKTFDLASAGRKKRAVDATTSTFFDMNDDFNLLYAYGTAIGGNLNKHQMHPKVSSQKADFQSFTDLSASAISKPQIKLHGILMMFAWLFFANFGIFMARFYKTVWPEGMEWCAQKRWFILHRSFMVTAFLLTVASFIVIFVHVGGYAKIEGNNFEKSHPIIGIVVMCLATINPIMALFRPHPGTPKRPYFNFAHISVGVTAYVCAVVNMFSGFDQSAADVPFSAKIVVWIYLGWIGLIELTSYIYDCQTRRGHDEGTSPILGYNSSKGEAYEMKSSAADHETVHQNVSRFKIGILCIHAVVLLSLVIAGAVIVGMGETEDKDDM